MIAHITNKQDLRGFNVQSSSYSLITKNLNMRPHILNVDKKRIIMIERMVRRFFFLFRITLNVLKTLFTIQTDTRVKNGGQNYGISANEYPNMVRLFKSVLFR